MLIKGFSQIELMIALGISATALMALMIFNKDFIKTSQQAEIATETFVLSQVISKALKNSQTCTANFQNAVIGKKITTLFDKNGQVITSINFQKAHPKIEEILIEDILKLQGISIITIKIRFLALGRNKDVRLKVYAILDTLGNVTECNSIGDRKLDLEVVCLSMGGWWNTATHKCAPKYMENTCLNAFGGDSYDEASNYCEAREYMCTSLGRAWRNNKCYMY